MSDLEELDSEGINELESLLYASIHYNDASSEYNESVKHKVDSENMPPPLQCNRIVSDTRVINNTVTAAKSRYWAGAKPSYTATMDKPATVIETDVFEEPSSSTKEVVLEPAEDSIAKSMPPPPVKATQRPVKSKQAASNNTKQRSAIANRKPFQAQQKPQAKTQQQQEQKQKIQVSNNIKDEPERFDQRLLVAIPPGPPPNKGKRNFAANGPFAKPTRKLEQLQRLQQKKQKSKLARQNKKPQKQTQDIELIDLVGTETSSDTDDVIHVPLSPPIIIDVDASDDQELMKAEPAYIEENAMDAADVKMGHICIADGEVLPVTPTMHSPCNSVMSSDDFIVQKDKCRLLVEQARATDEDLLVLTETAMTLNNETVDDDIQVESQQENEPADTSSEYEFVPPSKLEAIKQNYCVAEEQFRALDVYESESDLNEAGIYSKGRQKPTIIRSVDSPSGSSDVEELIDTAVNKTKRLRKRRSSSTNQSQSEPNNNDDDTDSDDGVQPTGVPGIARGMAVERCKRKIRRNNARRSTEAQMPQEQKDGESSDSVEELLPSAREIAERLLQREQARQKQSNQADEQCETVSIGSDANSADEAEFNDALCERISAVFKRIDTRASESRREMDSIAIKETPRCEDSRPKQSMDIEVIEDSHKNEETEPKTVEKDTADIKKETNKNDEIEPNNNNNLVEHHVEQLLEEPKIELTGWNDEMCRFYNDSWHGENFSLRKIQKSMNPQKNLWKLNNDDRYPTMRPRSKAKCTNCFEMGHIRSKCPRPRKPLVCSTCGKDGHSEPRCPNAICFGCGSRQPLYVQKCGKCAFQTRVVCHLCKMQGHSTEYCPDKWRRYHSTIRPNVPLETTVHNKTKHCSFCGTRGHLFENCRQRFGEFRHTNYTSSIVSYQKMYKDRGGPVGFSTDLKAFFSLSTPIKFKWSTNLKQNSYYARFLREVGLGNIIDQSDDHSTAALTQDVQQKRYALEYVPNPLIKAAQTANSKAKPVISKEAQEEPTVKSLTPKETSRQLVQQGEITTNFKTKRTDVINDNTSAKRQRTSATCTNPAVATNELDSDSNYSFSEHFELPTSTTNEYNTNTSNKRLDRSRPMEALPDMIPLESDDNRGNFNMVTNNNDKHMTGISMCVNNNTTGNDMNDSSEPSCMPDVPCEGKIVMARDQTEYLFSPEGREFLSTAAKACNVDVRMDLKEYGYILVIYGLKKNQEDLQLMLLRRNQEVKRKSTEFQGQKPPKRVDVLIRFMRDGINSLRSNLGNANNHYHRIKELEQMNTKNGYKVAERKRRLLNMILVGQAGLLNGSMHLDQLLQILKKLVDEHSPEENASAAMRSEIEEHWRMIFTPFQHSNYEALLQSYGNLSNKNRLPQLNIDPVLLGLQGNNSPKQLSSVRSVRTPQVPMTPPPPVWDHEQTQNKRLIATPRQQRAPVNSRQVTPPQRQPQVPYNVNRRIPSLMQLPFVNPQRARGNIQFRNTLKPECVKLLDEMGSGDSRSSINTDAKKPSVFWSRESLKYLDELFGMTNNQDTIERLERVLERSRRGQLSHNDYRAVIRLYSLFKSN